MTPPDDIAQYHAALSPSDRVIGEELFALIHETLPDAEAKVWHGHPVWFLDRNPIVGYNHKKSGMEVLFWSGQSFSTPGLRPLGTFRAASYSVPTLLDIDRAQFLSWLNESRTIQWNYAELPKNKSLNKLTNF